SIKNTANHKRVSGIKCFCFLYCLLDGGHFKGFELLKALKTSADGLFSPPKIPHRQRFFQPVCPSCILKGQDMVKLCQ
ncbi:hypothetical protein, partial [Acidaminobacter hydrogenoformans]|uniref:hypothetical protein n=1 Tax=Acidaminobacter hydrogenoformans TaxID=65403 RepID=UPI001A9A51D0